MNFKSLPELLDYFKDDQTCITYYENIRWNGNPVCPHCGAEKPYKTNRGYKCSNKECYKKFTVKVGTIFENSKIPFRIWFAAIYLCTSSKKGISSLQLHRQLGITQKSAWFVLHRIREMLKEKAPQMLEGAVEADETYVGGKSANWHKNKRIKMREAGTGYVHKTPVFGLLQRDGKVYTEMPKEATKEYLQPMILNKVKPGSILMTDGFGAYRSLNKIYQHEVINHQEGEYFREGFHTNTIEGFWGILKRGIIGIYHNVSPKHLHRYCDEFAGRYNTRTISDSDRFNYVISTTQGRLKYSDLTKGTDR